MSENIVSADEKLENQLCYVWTEQSRDAKAALVNLAAFAEFD